MKAPTARQKAQTLVALIRQEYPDPKSYSKIDLDGLKIPDDWYCVGIAAQRYSGKHFPDAGVPFATVPIPAYITLPNDHGDFEDAWLALTNYYERSFMFEASL